MSQEESKVRDTRPLTFKLAWWWSFGFAAVFALYGTVSLILGFLDRKYGEMLQPVVFLIIGIVLLFVAYAFKGRKNWGWYGEVVVNGAIVLLALFGLGQFGNIVLLVLAGAAIGLLFAAPTRSYLSRNA